MAQCSITLIRRAWNKIKKCLLQRQCERGLWILTAGGLLITSVSPLVCQRQKGNPRTDPEQEGIIHACVSDSSPDRSVQWTVCKDNRTNKSWGNKSGTWTPYHSVPGSVLCVMNREGTRAHVCVCVCDRMISTCSSTPHECSDGFTPMKPMNQTAVPKKTQLCSLCVRKTIKS